MIKVKREKNKITIIGHAFYDEYGKDIVCASVSSVVLCTINGILEINYDAIDTVEEQDKLEIIIKSDDTITTSLIDNMFNCLTKIEEQYPNNIKIKD